jgi:hypothetical protein
MYMNDIHTCKNGVSLGVCTSIQFTRYTIFLIPQCTCMFCTDDQPSRLHNRMPVVQLDIQLHNWTSC